ncbi:hypothetical protein GCG54_00003789 [Colletotrichum gloeosporioides]|uniref:Ankyrin repeat protein n=1 Tax=Colletotrichum gloeosporioides TaxID=474922 RepID=A0A8H4CE89_COLGL|nr:uncharacterized protein GCG54_00003789 [Colletotrichum gloeosporioides]KAF3802330.1 hypothetical protein GCG54_00003789 [Colletotrichum gloeosporioides]
MRVLSLQIRIDEGFQHHQGSVITLETTNISPFSQQQNYTDRCSNITNITGNMSINMFRGFIFAMMFAAAVMADEGDDFANNILSDLAPLLALFGEQVTMQFMSQSLGWADNILLAVAPLGIITIIVSAIRVGGLGFLKALIGRARENLAVAEQELMSSTSTETCELWNGHEVIRCMGSAPVTEFICLLPESGINESTKIQVKAFKDVNKHQLSEQEPLGLRLRKASPFHSPAASKENLENIIVTRISRKSAPNISLNAHNLTTRAEVRAAAVWGIVIQLGLVVFAACAVYHPSLSYSKDGSTIARHAFPCYSVGTLLLVVGMLLCAHVVESSTKETQFRPSQGIRAQLVWLQQTKTVSDQVFNSFAIYAKTERSSIMKSVRMDEDKTDQQVDKKSSSEDISSTQESTTTSEESFSAPLRLGASVGPFIGICGYIVQFLVAIVLLTATRSWVRRHLATAPASHKISPGYELDWFAATFANVGEAPWNPVNARARSGKGSDTDRRWQLGRLEANIDDSGSPVKMTDSSADDAPDSAAHAIVKIRRNLAQLSNWKGPASAEAISLARSIEAVMDFFFRHSEKESYTWSLKTVGRQSVQFCLTRKDGKWTAYSDELEAALSLWLFSAEGGEKEQEKDYVDALPVGDRRDDSWLRAEGSPGRRGLRVLGTYSDSLHRDLSWWMSSESARIVRAHQFFEGDDATEILEYKNHRVVGSAGVNSIPRQPGDTSKYRVTELSHCNVEHYKWADDDGPGVLATEFHGTLNSLYALDIFSSFFGAAAKTLEENSFSGLAEVHPNTAATGKEAWKFFFLRQDQLSNLAKRIENIGLGNLDDIYLSMIPSLSVVKKLPAGTAIVELARQPARLGLWTEFGGVYVWLLSIAKTYPTLNDFSIQVIAVALEFLRQVSMALDVTKMAPLSPDLEEWALKTLEDLKKRLQDDIRSWPEAHRTVAALLRLYKIQRREWECGIPLTGGSLEDQSSYDYPKSFHHTKLHQATLSDSHDPGSVVSAVLNEDINAKDIFGWTPLQIFVVFWGKSQSPRLIWMDATTLRLQIWTNA